MKVIAMIPARLGSQRLKQKNLQQINGESLIFHVVRKCISANVFDSIWVNTESDLIGDAGIEAGANFYKRPEKLADNVATSEDFIYDFLQSNECDYVVQVHSIAPLLTVEEIRRFTRELIASEADVQLSYEPIQIECSYENRPVNFSYEEKTNSQDLKPIQRVGWSITGWKRKTYIESYQSNKCATYAGKISYYPMDKMGAFVIKTKEDLEIARALFEIYNK